MRLRTCCLCSLSRALAATAASLAACAAAVRSLVSAACSSANWDLSSGVCGRVARPAEGRLNGGCLHAAGRSCMPCKQAHVLSPLRHGLNHCQPFERHLPSSQAPHAVPSGWTAPWPAVWQEELGMVKATAGSRKADPQCSRLGPCAELDTRMSTHHLFGSFGSLAGLLETVKGRQVVLLVRAHLCSRLGLRCLQSSCDGTLLALQRCVAGGLQLLDFGIQHALCDVGVQQWNNVAIAGGSCRPATSSSHSTICFAGCDSQGLTFCLVPSTPTRSAAALAVSSSRTTSFSCCSSAACGAACVHSERNGTMMHPLERWQTSKVPFKRAVWYLRLQEGRVSCVKLFVGAVLLLPFQLGRLELLLCTRCQLLDLLQQRRHLQANRSRCVPPGVPPKCSASSCISGCAAHARQCTRRMNSQELLTSTSSLSFLASAAAALVCTAFSPSSASAAAADGVVKKNGTRCWRAHMHKLHGSQLAVHAGAAQQDIYDTAPAASALVLTAASSAARTDWRSSLQSF